MRKKTSVTIVEQAIHAVPEFKKDVFKLEQQVTLRGQSKSALNNFIRHPKEGNRLRNVEKAHGY